MLVLEPTFKSDQGYLSRTVSRHFSTITISFLHLRPSASDILESSSGPGSLEERRCLGRSRHHVHSGHRTSARHSS